MRKINIRKLLKDLLDVIAKLEDNIIIFKMINIGIFVANIGCLLFVKPTAANMSSLAQLTFTFVFAIAAIGFTAFSLKIDSKDELTIERKKDLIRRYVIAVFEAGSLAVFTYMLSLFNLSDYIYSIYTFILLLSIQYLIYSTHDTITGYLNI